MRKVIVTMVYKRCERKKISVYNVLYVPKLACNLFSVRAAAAKGNTVKCVGLSDKYWAEAVVTGAYLRNCVPTRSFKEKTTLFEKWYGK